MHRFLIGMNRWGTVVMHRRLSMFASLDLTRVLLGPAWSYHLSLWMLQLAALGSPPLHWLSVAAFYATTHWRQPRARTRENTTLTGSVCIRRIDVALAETPIISRLVMRSRQTAMISMTYAIFERHITSIILNYCEKGAKYPPPPSADPGVVLVQPNTHVPPKILPPGTPLS